MRLALQTIKGLIAMRNHIMSAAAVLAAALLLALSVTSSASRLSYSSREFRIMWASLTFSAEEGGVAITCPVTLEGAFLERTHTKVTEALAARITRSTVGTCSEGRATILAETQPWDVTYQSFTGTLPNITGVRYALINAAFQVEPGLGIVCLARTSRAFPAAGEARREAGGKITSLTTDSALAIPTTGNAECPRFGIFFGSGEVYVQGSSTTRVTLTLI
ncbi:MAG TPA: hypothetical protein VKB03_09735 [Conexibacter sp.]|nr:hypothetical protein [Conexibacter sp.]